MLDNIHLKSLKSQVYFIKFINIRLFVVKLKTKFMIKILHATHFKFDISISTD